MSMRMASLVDKIEPFYVMEVAKAASKLAREVADTVADEGEVESELRHLLSAWLSDGTKL